MLFFKRKKTPLEFYNNCITKTHELAEKNGFIKGGVKFIPELMQYGERLMFSDLSSNEIRSQYSDNVSLIRIVSYRCLMYGIILANTWHNDFPSLNEIYDLIECDGPSDLIQELVEDELKFTPLEFSQWLEAVYMTCIREFGAIHDNNEEYSYKIMMACYQTGISMILSHFGL